MISYVAPDYPQEPDQQPEIKTSSNDSEEGPQIERAVVVSTIHGGVWTPMSVAQMYSGGRQVTFQRLGNRWATPQFTTARLDRRLRLNSFTHLRNAAFQQALPGVPGMQTPQFPEVPFTPQPPAKPAGTPPSVDVGDIRTVGVMNPSYIGVQFYSKNAPGGLAVFAEALMDVQDDSRQTVQRLRTEPSGDTVNRIQTAGVLVVAMVALFASGSVPVVGQVGPGYDIEMSRMIPMRDGVELEAWIFKPTHLTSKAPTVLELTQYDIDGGRQHDFMEFVRRGYVFVKSMVARDGVEPPTPAFSGLRSTT